MNTRTTIPISEARKRIFEIAEEVQKPDNYYTFTENGRPKAVLMSAADFESWQETMEVIRDFPDLKKDIKKAEEEYEKGSYVTLSELLLENTSVIADKPKKKYEVHAGRAKKSPKGNRKS